MQISTYLYQVYIIFFVILSLTNKHFKIIIFMVTEQKYCTLVCISQKKKKKTINKIISETADCRLGTIFLSSIQNSIKLKCIKISRDAYL